MRLTLAKMQMEDILYLEPRERDAQRIVAMDDWLGNIWEALNKGYGYTIFRDKDVVACIGVTSICKGVAEIWAITSKLVEEYPKEFHKICKEIVKLSLEKGELHRLQCTAEVDYDITNKWLQRLGFEREGVLRNYTSDKKDMYIYSIIREGA